MADFLRTLFPFIFTPEFLSDYLVTILGLNISFSFSVIFSPKYITNEPKIIRQALLVIVANIFLLFVFIIKFSVDNSRTVEKNTTEIVYLAIILFVTGILFFLILWFVLWRTNYYSEKRLKKHYMDITDKEQREQGEINIIGGGLDFLGVIPQKIDNTCQTCSGKPCLLCILFDKTRKCGKCYKRTGQYNQLVNLLRNNCKINILCHKPIAINQMETTGVILGNLLNIGSTERVGALSVKFYREDSDDIGIRGRIIETNDNSHKICWNFKRKEKFSKCNECSTSTDLGRWLLLTWDAMWDKAVAIEDVKRAELINLYTDRIESNGSPRSIAENLN